MPDIDSHGMIVRHHAYAHDHAHGHDDPPKQMLRGPQL